MGFLTHAQRLATRRYFRKHYKGRTVAELEAELFERVMAKEVDMLRISVLRCKLYERGLMVQPLKGRANG